jgi:hypothetical protein
MSAFGGKADIAVAGLAVPVGLVHHPAARSYFNGLQEFAKTAPQLCSTSNSIQVNH